MNEQGPTPLLGTSNPPQWAGAESTSVQRRKKDGATRQEFRQSLALLDWSTSWFLWSSVLMIILLSATIVLVSLPGPLLRRNLLDERCIEWMVCGLLGLMGVVNLLILRQQRHLKVFRNHLIELMDAAMKHRVRAERFYEMSILDPLTGLYNRRFGETRLREEMAEADKSGDPLLLLALDFDHFKEINDQYGHHVGDLALKKFARRLQRAIRACDVPIRVGGDEFLVILPQCPPDNLHIILTRLDSVDVNLDGQKIAVSFSWGVAQYQVNDTAQTMIKRADERLYAAKAKRPNVLAGVFR
jgi:diguanylate cyclase (GGDEF)-like protein